MHTTREADGVSALHTPREAISDTQYSVLVFYSAAVNLGLNVQRKGEPKYLQRHKRAVMRLSEAGGCCTPAQHHFWMRQSGLICVTLLICVSMMSMWRGWGGLAWIKKACMLRYAC